MFRSVSSETRSSRLARAVVIAAWGIALFTWPLMTLLALIAGVTPSAALGPPVSAPEVLPAVGSVVFLYGVPVATVATGVWLVVRAWPIRPGMLAGSLLLTGLCALAAYFAALILFFVLAPVLGI